MKKYKGLTDEEIIISREKYGTNEIKKKKNKLFIIKLLEIFTEPMFLLLLITSSVYFITRQYSDGIMMLIFVLVICFIEFIQNQKTDKAIEELNKLSALEVKVIRNHKQIIIDSKDIVVGDIIFLEEGDRVPADCIILECEGFATLESSLTGESDTIYKTNKEDKENYYKHNYCYSGTSVTSGHAIVKVLEVGINTEFGKIGNSINEIQNNKTPLEKQTNKLIIISTIVCILFSILTVATNYINNSDLEFKNRIIESIISGITVAMAAIPEEIPVILTVFLAMGSLSLSKENTLTRNKKAIETLGAITVLCTDKTGTLTENKMVVEDIYECDKDFYRVANLSCQKAPTDPMEIAIKNYCLENIEEDDNLKPIYEYIFNSEEKMVGQIYNIDNKKKLYVKGAIENILLSCNLSIDKIKEINDKADNLSKKGYRVIALAKNDNIDEIKEKISDNKLSFVGLVALSDPVREGVAESIKKCNDASIRVIMITGDNGSTAKAIASKININNDNVMLGEEIEKMSDEELIEKVKYTNIFARVYPKHKMRIVEALQINNEIVAMTGDGINDTPALKKAEVGIAMGNRGTSVAKEAADIILLDDNFNTIVKAIENGRTIYINIQKAFSYILTIHIPIILLSFIVPLFKLPNLLNPIHIVLLELLIDPTSSIIFQKLKPDKEIMKEKPRNVNESIINFKLMCKCIFQGLFIFLIVFIFYNYMIINNYGVALASTMSYATLVISIIIVAYNLESSKITISNIISGFKDKITLIVNGIILLGLILFIYLPFFNQTSNTCGLNLVNWLIVICLSSLTVIPFDILKS